MLSGRRNIRRKARAFTLVEMLVVGALIALFAGMAIIGVQQQFRSNQRKAVIGESRQVASALDFAYNDLGFFPKISFLQDSLTSLRIESQAQFGGPDAVFDAFSAYSVPTTRQNIDQNWRGPYFAASQSRSGIAQGRGGSRMMQVRNSATDPGWPWPIDTWNNPYMFYSMHIDPDDSTLYFTTAQEGDPTVPNTSAGIVGNMVNAVVSYGPNQVPGGGENFFVQVGAPTDLDPTAGPFGLRLYTGDPNNTTVPLRLMTGLDLVGTDGFYRANAWNREYAERAGISVDVASTPLALDNERENAVGITDIGSDDVVFTF